MLEAIMEPVRDSQGQIPGELVGSLSQILSYAPLPEERKRLFYWLIEQFRGLGAKFFTEPSGKRIRETITSMFFEIYEGVLKRVLAEDNRQPLFKMFLAFGYMDERLLAPEHVNFLYQAVQAPVGTVPYTVCDMKEWLVGIYDMKREPSVNEFGQDYQDMFREKKRRRELTDKDKPAYDENRQARLDHEMEGLFKLGQRLCYGKLGGYFPILHEGMITRDLASALVTPQGIAESLSRILALDFSAFHREIVYNRPEKGIVRELIMKAVYPEFILVPTFGVRGVVWQELTGRVSASPARFLIPVFCERSLDEVMLDLVAEFRWDLSKTMAGYVVKNTREHSLYGDYNDYIQFYSKNGDLTPEGREKVRKQIEKYRGNVRSIFVSDYRTWLSYESDGLIRLNKVARGILFKYCPFPAAVRERLARQPLFNPMVVDYERERQRKLKLLEAHYRKLTRGGEPLDPELMGNLDYYRM